MIAVLEGLLRSQRLRAYEAVALAGAIAKLKGAEPELRSGAQGGALCHSECEGCGGARANGQPLCGRCMGTLPGGVAYDVRRGVAGAFAKALEVLHS